MPSPEAIESTTTANARLQARLMKLQDGLHRAYCMAVCLDRALRFNESDDSPELAVCVTEYLVRPLDALSIEAARLRQEIDAHPQDAESTFDPSR